MRVRIRQRDNAYERLDALSESISSDVFHDVAALLIGERAFYGETRKDR